MQKSLCKGALAACGLALSSAISAATPSGAMLGNACAGCHGTHGVSQGPATPTIAGMGKEAFMDAMMAFKEEDRFATIMNRIAKGYSKKEFEAMADYFGRQTFQPADQKADAALAEKGAKLHETFCEKCHEEGGKSSEDSGVIAGQWLPYLIYSFEDFSNGSREIPNKMKRKIEKMHQQAGDEGIKQLLHYYASQK